MFYDVCGKGNTFNLCKGTSEAIPSECGSIFYAKGNLNTIRQFQNFTNYRFSESIYSRSASIHFIGNGGHEENKMNSDGRPTTNNAPMKTKNAIFVVPVLVLLVIYNIIVGQH